MLLLPQKRLENVEPKKTLGRGDVADGSRVKQIAIRYMLALGL